MRLVCLLLVLFLNFVCSAASDWPQWRGPNRDGKSGETGLLDRWPAGGPPLFWKTNGLGRGFSSVSVANGRIFTSGDRTDASFVHALSVKGGDPLWSAKLGRPGDPGGYAGTRSTPTVDNDLVFALSQYGDLICLDTSSGRELWRKNMEKDFGGKMMSGWGYSESPLVDGDKLIVTPGGSKGTLIALNKKTGELLWQSTDFKDRAAYSSVVKAELGGLPQYIQLTDSHVVGLDTMSGRMLWQAIRRGDTAVIPTPIVHNNHVYVTSGYGVGCNLFRVTKTADAWSAKQVYANKVMVNHHGGVILVGNHLYGYSDGKGWTCQEFASGKMVWEEKAKLGKGSLVFADGHFYLRAESGKGTIVLIQATPNGYRERSRFDQPERSSHQSWPHPVISDGKLYIRDQDLLLCFDVSKK